MTFLTNSNFVVIFTSLIVIFVASEIVFSEIVESNYIETQDGRIIQKRAAPPGNVGSTPGYRRPVNPNATETLSVAKRIMTKLNARRLWNCKQKLFKIFGGSTQVITGLRVQLDLEICNQGCGRIIHDEDCRNCTIEVWERSWENYFEIITYGCSDGKSNVVRVNE